MKRFKLTFIHPAVGHRAGESYVRTWQMESLPIAVLAGLTTEEIDVAFYDDRMEAIDYDAPTDAVAIPIETYTAARAYQIASEYRLRGIPVVMGGFHATLVPDEVSRFADAVVTGEADSFVFRNFFLVNALHRNEISQRNGYPLGDETWTGQLLEVQ